MTGDGQDPPSVETDGATAGSTASEASEPPGETAAKPPSHRYLSRLAWGAGGLMIGALAMGLAWHLSLRPTIPPLVRFAADLPEIAPLALSPNPMALSPDGRLLAYTAQVENETELYLRPLDQMNARPVPGTKNGCSPFFAPDGTWIGYFDIRNAKLKKLAVSGGDPVVLGEARSAMGASWGPDGSIIYAPDIFSGLWRIVPGAGKPEQLTELGKGESSHRWPEILPDGKAVIFSVCAPGAEGKMRLAALSLRNRQKKMLLEGASEARYSVTGHLLFLRGADLMAVSFDPGRLEVRGKPFLLKQGIEADQTSGAGHFAFSRTGVLAFSHASEDADLRTLAWADRQGGFEKLTVTRGAFSYPRISPDGRRLAVVIHSLEGKSDIWTVEIATGSFSRLTVEGNNSYPVWTPDNLRVTFASDRSGPWNLYWAPVDGSRQEELIQKSDLPQIPSSWSHDGRSLVYTEYSPATGPDIWSLSFGEGRSAEPFLKSVHAEWGGVFSRDGTWLAYTSDDSGPDQVYVRPFPGPGEKVQISTAEGRGPVWGPGDGELLFRSWKGLMGVAFSSQSEFNAGPPRILVPGDFEAGDIPAFANYDVSPDGQRFVLVPRRRREKTRIFIDLNCFAEIRQF